MALFAKSNVDRFQEEGCGSGLGPGDYDACVPKSTGHAAGVASLGFTSGKALASSQRDENIPEETEAIFSAVRDRRPGIGVAALSSLAPRRASIAGSRPSLVGGASKLNKVEAEHQSRHLAWSERERGKIEAELAKLRAREVRAWYSSLNAFSNRSFGVLSSGYLSLCRPPSRGRVYCCASLYRGDVMILPLTCSSLQAAIGLTPVACWHVGAFPF